MAPQMESPKDNPSRQVGSILALDCGSAFSRAILVERVEGTYRLVACGEALTRAADGEEAVAGVRRAIQRVTEVTGRALLSERGFPHVPERADGTGVDAIVATLSAPPPLKVWLIGLVEEQSLASGLRACQAPYATVCDVLSLVDPAVLDDVGGLAARLQRLRPDVLFLVGGTDEGAEGPLRRGMEALSLAALALPEEARPVLLYGGNSRLRQAVEEVAGPAYRVHVVENVRPSPERERLIPAQSALEALYLEKATHWDPSLDLLQSWGEHPLQTTARALGHTVRYLALQAGMDVLAVDLGARSTTVAAQRGQAFTLRSLPGLGMGAWWSDGPRPSPERLAAWLPEAIPPEEVLEVAATLAAYPFTMGQTGRELLVEQSLAREVLAQALEKAGLRPGLSWDLIIGCGGFLGHLPRPSQAALVLLDALQPVGVAVLAVDTTFLGPALGAIAAVEPLAAAQVLEQDAFLKLGTAVCLDGRGRDGDLALRVRVRYENGDTLSVEVRAGTLEVIPLALGERAELELRPGRGFTLGPAHRGRTTRVHADGGVLGVVVDARGRPLGLPADPEARQRKVQEWRWALGA
ncbi:MAG: glutamate mutase L [Anaerolineae bacterium]